MFEAETDDLAAIIAELNNRVNMPDMPVSDAFSFEGMHFEIFADLVRSAAG